jgi:hypothetical protein
MVEAYVSPEFSGKNINTTRKASSDHLRPPPLLGPDHPVSTCRPYPYTQMKTIAVGCALIALPSLALSQTIINSTEFFAPAFKARRPGNGGILTLNVDPTLYSVTSTPSTGENVAWSHGATGFAEVGVGALGNVQLAAFTETTGNSLVFGRELTTRSILGVLENVDSLVGQVVQANVLSTWSSQANVTGLNILQGQVYEARFNLSYGAGLPLDFLENIRFGITNEGISDVSQSGALLVDILGLVSIGDTPDSGSYAFQFTSDADRDSLEFSFDAKSKASLGLLGGAEGNRNVLTFSGFEVVAVPEPSSFALASLAGTALLLRRKRRL